MDAAIWVVAFALAIFSIFTRLHVRRLERRIGQVRSGAMLEAEQTALDATLPAGFQWGREATESFEFGKQRAAQAIHALLK